MLLAAAIGCRGLDSASISAHADTTAGAARAGVLLTGLTSEELRRHADQPREFWYRAFRVTVRGDTTPIVGRYVVADAAVRFQPAFPFDLGREYAIAIDGTALSDRRGVRVVADGFQLPAPSIVPSTRVAQIYPTLDTLPENQLRLYVEFSAPMSRDGGLPYVKLLDSDGREVRNAFLPLDADFWNREHTRYTLFLDPGRVKRGILPNDEMGRALIAGREYSIVVDSAWRDGRGQPLVSSFVKRFRASPAILRPIRFSAWRIEAPRPATTDPLVVAFGEPLDHGLLQRAIGVERANGQSVEGTIAIPRGERAWRFTPSAPWQAGDYRLIALDFLEDLAGNRINRAFEVDLFQRADSTPVPSRSTVPFRIR